MTSRFAARASARRGLVVAALSAALFAGAARADEAPPVASTPAPAAPATTPGAAAADASKHLDRADVLREEGKYAESGKEYVAALAQDDTCWRANVQRQAVAVYGGATAGLVAEYDDRVAKHPGDLAMRLHRLRLDPPASRVDALAAMLKTGAERRPVLVELGRALLASGDAPSAKKALEEAWALAAVADEGLLLSAEALRRSGDAAGARARLEEAVRANPDGFEALLDLARLDLLEGKPLDARKHAEQVIALRATYVAALLVRSEACAKTGALPDALSSLDAVLKINPDDADAAVALADLTAKGANADGLKKAIELYKRAGALRGASALRVLYGTGWADERLAALPDALAAYKEAGTLAPGDAGVENSYGVVLLRQKHYNESLVHFKKALDLDPDSTEALVNSASVYDAQGEWAEAIKWYKRVLAIKGQEKNLRALVGCAFDYEATSNFQNAEDLLEKAVATKPEDAELRTYYGDNQSFQHKWKTAEKAYQEATRLDDANRYAWRGLGLALTEDDKPQEAVTALEKAKTLKADDLPTLLGLGDLYAAKDVHDVQKAIDNYQAYVKAGGTDPDVPTILEELQKELDDQKKAGK